MIEFLLLLLFVGTVVYEATKLLRTNDYWPKRPQGLPKCMGCGRTTSGKCIPCSVRRESMKRKEKAKQAVSEVMGPKQKPKENHPIKDITPEKDNKT